MNREQALAWLPLVGVKPPAEQNRGGWIVSACPLGPWRHENGHSHDTAFAVKIEPGESFCNCFSCAFHGSQGDLLLELGMLNKKSPAVKCDLASAFVRISEAEDGMLLSFDSPGIEEQLFGDKPADHRFDETWLQTFPKALETELGAAYLHKRSVSPSIAEALDLRCDTSQQRVCVPVRDFDNVLRGLHGRAIQDGVDPRYRMYKYKNHTNPLHWLGEHWVDQDKPILVVEGPFDLFSAMRVYRNVVSPLFANPSFEKLHRMSNALEWVTLLDNGKAGDLGRSRITQALSKNVVTHRRPPAGKDPGSMLVGELVHALQDCLDLDEILLA